MLIWKQEPNTTCAKYPCARFLCAAFPVGFFSYATFLVRCVTRHSGYRNTKDLAENGLYFFVCHTEMYGCNTKSRKCPSFSYMVINDRGSSFWIVLSQAELTTFLLSMCSHVLFVEHISLKRKVEKGWRHDGFGL